jgi:hypothetical protein
LWDRRFGLSGSYIIKPLGIFVFVFHVGLFDIGRHGVSYPTCGEPDFEIWVGDKASPPPLEGSLGYFSCLAFKIINIEGLLEQARIYIGGKLFRFGRTT